MINDKRGRKLETRICIKCCKEFLQRKDYNYRKFSNFCSFECKAGKPKLIQTSYIPALCLQCKNPIIWSNRRNKFCSKTCHSQSKELRVKTPKYQAKPCYCGKLTKPYAKFCSFYCRFSYLGINEWLEEDKEITGWSLEQIPEVIRTYLMIEAEYKCTQCGWSEVNNFTNKIPLEVDHVDGDFKNNSRNNLRVLCKNCHSLTKTYGALNIGNGRPNRLAKLKQKYGEIV